MFPCDLLCGVQFHLLLKCKRWLSGLWLAFSDTSRKLKSVSESAFTSPTFANTGATWGWPGNVCCHISDVIMKAHITWTLIKWNHLLLLKAALFSAGVLEALWVQWTFSHEGENQKLPKSHLYCPGVLRCVCVSVCCSSLFNGSTDIWWKWPKFS